MRSFPVCSVLAIAGMLVLVPGCADDPVAADDPDDSVFVDDGKVDDYFSTSALEYLLEGRTSVTLDAALASAPAATRLAEAKKLIFLKQTAIAWFLTQYLLEKDDDATNASFGGFGGIAKAGAYEELAITERADKLTFDFTFRQHAAGKRNLISLLPVRVSGGKQVFELEIGKPTNEEMARLETNAEWYREAPWNDWNPATVPADKKEKITFSIAKDKPSSDGFFDIARLTADGTIDIDVYFGWDYWSEYHIKHSQAFFRWLVERDFRAPVASWDQLTRTSGPFTRTVKADGKTVNVEVRMFFGKAATDTDPDTDAGGRVLEDEARRSLATRDVVIYSGHSGPFYGFALANWKKTSEGDLDDADMRTMTLPADRYQIVLAEGCDTYQIGTAFKENPNKAGRNIDVVGTNAASNAASPASVENFVGALLARDSLQRLRPQPVSTLLTKLDNASWGFQPMYGIHGIDDNPKLVPFANTTKFGEACTKNSDCGGPGNLCVAAGGRKTCTAACATTGQSGCGTGYTCKAVASAATSTIYGRACAKL